MVKFNEIVLGNLGKRSVLEYSQSNIGYSNFEYLI